MPTLLVRPRPIGNESAMGYLLRLAEANGFASLLDLDWLSSTAEEGIGGMLRVGSMLNGIPLNSLRGPVTHFRHLKSNDVAGLESHYWNGRRPRYCPACLAANPHWHAVWDISLFTACPVHCCQLLDSCPGCHRPLSWKRRHILTCDCGFFLSDSAPEKADPRCILVSSCISAMINDTTAHIDLFAVPSALHHLRLADLLTICVFLGGYAQNEMNKPTKIADLHDISVATVIAMAAGDAFANWPSGYHNLLGSLVSKGCSEAYSTRLTKRFGYFYTALYKRFGDGQFDFLRDEFEAYVRAEWPGQLAERNRRFSRATRLGHNWIPLTTAAKQIGVKRSTVCSLIERGLLCGQIHSTTAGRISGTVRRDALEAFCIEKARWMTLTEAREALQLSRKGVHAYLRSGKLCPLSGPTVDGRAVWRFSATDVIALVRQESANSMDSKKRRRPASCQHASDGQC